MISKIVVNRLRKKYWLCLKTARVNLTWAKWLILSSKFTNLILLRDATVRKNGRKITVMKKRLKWNKMIVAAYNHKRLLNRVLVLKNKCLMSLNNKISYNAVGEYKRRIEKCKYRNLKL